ncbi:RNA polymerase II elongation factor ELL-like, partial [Argonauta hians]
MSSLENHSKYTMSTSCGGDITVIHTIFTEFILEKFQDFLRNPTTNLHYPTIKVGNDGSGFIQIPVYSLEKHGELYTFYFNSYCVQDKANGIFYCLQQVLSKDESCLNSMGRITHKLVMRGTRNSFKEFRKRMHVEEAKRIPAKEIRLSKNHKYKKFFSRPDYEVSHNKTHVYERHERNLISDNNSSKKSSFTLHDNLDISPYFRKVSLRKRIIHLLAIRPYNKRELLRLLKRQGFSENDKKSFEFKLNEVSTCYKRQRLTLTISAWKEVDDKWPYYRVEQRQLVRRRLNSMYCELSDGNQKPFYSTDFEIQRRKLNSNTHLHNLDYK